MSNRRHAQLHQLARLYDIQTAYQDIRNRRREASFEALLAVLRLLGAPVKRPSDLPSAITARREALWQRLSEPVVVAWDGGAVRVDLRLPASIADRELDFRIRFETGGAREGRIDLKARSPLGSARVGGKTYIRKQILFAKSVPIGYHHITLEMQGRSRDILLISAPRGAYLPKSNVHRRTWGLFLPLYALHSKTGPGAGTFSDLMRLSEWAGRLGAGVVGTLPLLPTFLDECFEPSPYFPVSRLFWNEFYIDIKDVPEFKRIPKAKALTESRIFQRELKALRSTRHVDYRKGMALKRKVLENLSHSFFLGPAPRRTQAFLRFLHENQMAEDYARFRASCEREKRPWSRWPARQRDGFLQKGDFDDEAMRYHLYVQWVADEQLKRASQAARRYGPGLYLDLPLGVHPDGYDVWRERELFVLDAKVGAPPDTVFTKGQDWGFPPPHPETGREKQYAHTIATLRHHLKYAGVLRLDHVMGLHRLFWIPKGFDTMCGLYVRYRSDELYAISSLESHRYRSLVVGENLGTVPPEVNCAMEKHHLQRMYILQYELPSYPRKTLQSVDPDVVAGLNTHDMFPFSVFWKGKDIEKRRRLGLLSEAGARRERKERHSIRKTVMAALERKGWLSGTLKKVEEIQAACLKFLSRSPARILLINLEDLWLESEPQNIPGTGRRRPNWQKKARYPFEELAKSRWIVETLREIARLRKSGVRR